MKDKGWHDITPPCGDRCALYPQVDGINCSDFDLIPKGLSVEQLSRALNQLHEYQDRQKGTFLGYQANQALDFETDLHRYLNFHINNLGDPFQPGNFTVNSKWMERAVLDYYAALWRARWPHNPKDPESYWGYVVSMGCTEGNIYGLWNARDYLAGKALLDDPLTEEKIKAAGDVTCAPRKLVYQQAPAPKDKRNAYTPVAFFSEDTHYSIVKAMRVLAIHTFYEIGINEYPNQCPLPGGWPLEVPSHTDKDKDGSIDVEKLAKLVRFFAAKGYPILICLNYGSTFKGAYDDVEAVGKAIMPTMQEFGLDTRKVIYDPQHPDLFDVRTGYWIHVDGALGAAYMPFVEMAYHEGRTARRGPNFDFRLDFVHSLAMSGHKWIGAPWPCGIYMTKVKMQLRPPDDPEYIGTFDSTFAGSRNGFSSMILWDYLAKNSYEQQITRALRTEELALYAEDQLKALGERKQLDLWVKRSPLSLTIRFRSPNDKIKFKYSLSGETLLEGGEQRSYNHIYMMPHVTQELIDSLIKDLEQDGAFPNQTQKAVMNARPVATNARTLLHVPHTGRGFR